MLKIGGSMAPYDSPDYANAFTAEFPKLCASKDTEVCRESFIVWQKNIKFVKSRFAPW